MTKTPTIRSEFTIQQFEAEFQKLAYQIALEAIQKMPTQPASPYTTLQFMARGPTIEFVATLEESIKFENGIVYSKKQATKWGNWFNFTIEEKIYAQSSHSTKISFYCDEKEVKEFQSKIQAIIDKLMAGVKPEPRFSLASRHK